MAPLSIETLVLNSLGARMSKSFEKAFIKKCPNLTEINGDYILGGRN